MPENLHHSWSFDHVSGAVLTLHHQQAAWQSHARSEYVVHRIYIHLSDPATTLCDTLTFSVTHSELLL